MNNLDIGDTCLLTTDYFLAPDGKQYRAVFGTIKGVFDDKDTLGIRTNAKSTNWYVEIGNMTIAGCQIKYAVKVTKDKVNFNGKIHEESWGNGTHVTFNRASLIYDADEE